MYLTEEEAKHKWCPNARTGLGKWSEDDQWYTLDKPVVNAVLIIKNDTRAAQVYRYKCIGSECMAWRWHGKPSEVPLVGEPTSPLGYCGAFGRPVEDAKED